MKLLEKHAKKRSVVEPPCSSVSGYTSSMRLSSSITAPATAQTSRRLSLDAFHVVRLAILCQETHQLLAFAAVFPGHSLSIRVLTQLLLRASTEPNYSEIGFEFGDLRLHG